MTYLNVLYAPDAEDWQGLPHAAQSADIIIGRDGRVIKSHNGTPDGVDGHLLADVLQEAMED